MLGFTYCLKTHTDRNKSAHFIFICPPVKKTHKGSSSWSMTAVIIFVLFIFLFIYVYPRQGRHLQALVLFSFIKAKYRFVSKVLVQWCANQRAVVIITFLSDITNTFLIMCQTLVHNINRSPKKSHASKCYPDSAEQKTSSPPQNRSKSKADVFAFKG